MKYLEYKFDNFKILVRNIEEAQRIVNEKFEKEEYKFELKTETPFIIDCGAHIGITSLYFKKLFPKSEILAFEPDAENHKLYNENMKLNELHDVECINAALSHKEGEGSMFTRNETESPWTWANSIVKNIWGPDNPYNKEVKINTKRLSEYITKKVDLLKLDIEGAEETVLKEIEDKLINIENIVLEFHGTKYNRETNDILRIANLLLSNDFQITITPVDLTQNPSEHFKQYVKEVELRHFILKATKSFAS